MLGKDSYCVIMAGGTGTRLWPLSRKGIPKQFIDFRKDGTTMIQRLYRCMAQLFPPENIIVSTNLDYYETACDLLPEMDHSQILREPAKKGTGPSMIMAAYFIRDMNPDAKVLVIPSDIMIIDEEPYSRVIEKGMEFVGEGNRILTVGIPPTRPETRYGYIQIDDTETDGFHKVRTFTEKPEESFAKVFVESGEFYWNSGMLMWSVDTFLDTASVWLPEIYAQMKGIFDTHHDRNERRSLTYACYEAFPHASVDRSILENADNVYMMRGDFRWNDIESWDLLYDICAKDADANVTDKDITQVYNCQRSLLIENNQKKLLVVDGLEDFLVVDTKDVLLICRRDNEEAFKKYINDARLRHGEEFL